MRGFMLTSLLLATVFAASCAVDSRPADPDDPLTSMAYGGITYGGGTVRSRGGGSVKDCFAGPMGVLLPNRFVHCYCDQLVKDCGQDSTCATCSSSRYEQCASSTWFSSVSYLAGSCNVSELNECTTYCQQSCSSSCKAE